ncbi:hypothetical protein QAD02_020384 [Eretmocerus hayati]|uniref:Uncharacterized protein n=1 Tax=Eretmocerus hayati TaxID=131215 RepID=A0ACC2PMH6_9HYME|nr:hypothetical protein QAD02_020384 [Eretmocerus hayati]
MTESVGIFGGLDPTNNFVEILTKREVMNNLKTTTFCHDIVGVVTKVYLCNRGMKILNLEIKVEDDSTWALVAWEDDAEIFEDTFHIGHVYHFDGLYIQAPKKNPNVEADYCCGKSIKLTIKSNTVVTDLTKLYFPQQNIQEIVPSEVKHQDIKFYEKIQNCVDENFKNNSFVGLKAFIRVPFVQANPDVPLRWGALTDGDMKITTVIRNYSDDTVTEQKKKELQDIRLIVKTPQKPDKDSPHSLTGSAVKKRIERARIEISPHGGEAIYASGKRETAIRFERNEHPRRIEADNYKGSHSIVLLAVCDSEYNFTYYDVGSYGRRSDGGVYAESSLAEKLLDGSLDIPPPEIVVEGEPPLHYCFFGDEAFPLQPWLMCPFPGKGCCFLEQRLFNYRMGQPRRFIENTFGILASRWRIFRKPILMQPIYLIDLAKAAVCLHNWLRMTDQDYIPNGLADRQNQDGQIIPGRWREECQNDTAFAPLEHTTRSLGSQAIDIRQRFCNLFSTSYAIPGQYRHV